MLKNIKKRNEGFTIIEVLIVLAIAGLILLVVFLAVPALQRNSRNTQRTNDASNALSIITEYSNNNNGKVPTAAVLDTNGTLTIGATGTNQVTTKLGFYGAGKVTLEALPGSPTEADSEEEAVIYTGAKCNDNGTAAVTGSSRSVAIVYMLENNSKQCKAS